MSKPKNRLKELLYELIEESPSRYDRKRFYGFFECTSSTLYDSKAIYTTNAIKSINMGLRKIIKNRGSFPTDEAAIKLLYLALDNMSKKWTPPIQDWDGERSLESHNLTHKYLDLKINLSELLQILCETLRPTL
ncbi:transposase, mutator-like family protein, partial [Leptospira borgpetersenii str. UI 09149]